MIRFIASCLLLLAGCVSQAIDTIDVRIAAETFQLELAITPFARSQGLSDREQLPADGGMLFIYPEAQIASFVMRRCLIPLDLVLLDGKGRVVNLHAMQVEPYDTPEHRLTRYRSDRPVRYAIELPAGTTERLELEEGMQIELPPLPRGVVPR